MDPHKALRESCGVLAAGGFHELTAWRRIHESVAGRAVVVGELLRCVFVHVVGSHRAPWGDGTLGQLRLQVIWCLRQVVIVGRGVACCGWHLRLQPPECCIILHLIVLYSRKVQGEAPKPHSLDWHNSTITKIVPSTLRNALVVVYYSSSDRSFYLRKRYCVPMASVTDAQWWAGRHK